MLRALDELGLGEHVVLRPAGLSEEDARLRLLDAWALIGPLASSLADRAAHTVKCCAERDDFERTRSH